MKIKYKRELILSLIKDDLTSMKLVSGLNALGLDADHYSPFLGDTIFTLMGFEENEQSDLIYERVYIHMTERAKQIDFKYSKDELDSLALNIYNELIQAKNLLQK